MHVFNTKTFTKKEELEHTSKQFFYTVLCIQLKFTLKKKKHTHKSVHLIVYPPPLKKKKKLARASSFRESGPNGSLKKNKKKTLTWISSLSSSIPQLRGSLGHHRWFCNQFSPFSPFTTALWDLPNSGPVHSLMLSSHLLLCLLVLLHPSSSPARRPRPHPTNGRHDHTTAVCVSLQSSEGPRVVQLPAESRHEPPCWQHGRCMRCVVSCSSTSLPWLVIVFAALLWGSMTHKA